MNCDWLTTEKAAGISVNTNPDSQSSIKPPLLIPVSEGMLLRHFSAISMLSSEQPGGTRYLRKSVFCLTTPNSTIKSTDLQAAYEISE